MELNHIRMLGQALCMERAETGGSGADCLDHRRSMVSWIPINEHTSWIYEKLTDHIRMVNERWFKFDLDKIERLQFTHYNSTENGCYKSHTDPLNWRVPHNRKLSVVIQLSDPSEYEGGELILHNSHDNSFVEKQKGYTIFFPSYTLHEVTPVTKGERFTAVEIISAKRDKYELNNEQIDWTVDAYTRGVIADEQMSALLMAILLNGMNSREISRWTDAMRTVTGAAREHPSWIATCPSTSARSSKRPCSQSNSCSNSWSSSCSNSCSNSWPPTSSWTSNSTSTCQPQASSSRKPSWRQPSSRRRVSSP